MIATVQHDGFSTIRGLLDAQDISRLISALGHAPAAGRRGMLAVPAVQELAASSKMLDAVRPHISGTPRPVRAIFFDKSPGINWLVPWHQDLTISVRARVESVGFGPWSTKDGLPHVQPPVDFLEDMLTIRLFMPRPARK